MQEENKDLRILSNTVEVIGTLKSKNLEIKTAKTSGKKYMSGQITVLSKSDNKVNEHRVNVFMMESSKLFKGIETVKNEYKSIEEVGEEEADRIRVTGELDFNQYYNREGKLVEFNEIKGVFFNRVDNLDESEDRAIATIDTVVEGFIDKMDQDGLPTGEKEIKGFSVGWGNNVIQLKDTIVKKELAEAMQNLYQPGSTGQLTFKLNNYVEVEEQEEEVSVSHGFGSQEVVGNLVAKNFVNNIEVIGGQVPYLGSIEYTQEEIEQAHKVNKLNLQTLQKPAPTTPQVKEGFDSPSAENKTSLDSEIPDF